MQSVADPLTVTDPHPGAMIKVDTENENGGVLVEVHKILQTF